MQLPFLCAIPSNCPFFVRPYRSIAGKDSKAAVYDALSGSYLFKISASAEIKSMRFSRDGTSIGIACRNKLKALTLWPGKPDFSEEHLLNDGDELYTKKLKKGANCLDFSPCGTMVVNFLLPTLTFFSVAHIKIQ